MANSRHSSQHSMEHPCGSNDPGCRMMMHTCAHIHMVLDGMLVNGHSIVVDVLKHDAV